MPNPQVQVPRAPLVEQRIVAPPQVVGQPQVAGQNPPQVAVQNPPQVAVQNPPPGQQPAGELEVIRIFEISTLEFENN
jgi:hypothetical protein